MDTITNTQRFGPSHIIQVFLMLLGYGILWGWLWFSAAMAIPFFYVVAQGVDIGVYGFVGVRLCRHLERFAMGDHVRRAFGVLGILIFYLGNRLISLTLIIGSSSFTEVADGERRCSSSLSCSWPV